MRYRIALVVVSFVLSVLIGLSVSQAGRGGVVEADAEGGDDLLIGFSMDTLKEARWQKDRDYFVEQAESLGAKVLVQSANSDDTRQMQDVQALISRDVDVLVIIPHNGAAMAQGVRVAHENGIPVISYDRMITDCDVDVCVGFDSVMVGEMQAQYLIDHLPTPGKGKIVRIYGAKTDQNAFIFKKGQDNVLMPYIERGDIEVIHEDWAANWNPENAKKITNAAISNHGSGFDAILASNDGTANGAIQALKEEGVAGKIIVTGQDADLVACQNIAAGIQSMTVYKPIKSLARKAAEVAVKMAGRKPIVAKHSMNNNFTDVPAVLLEVVRVTKENMRETVIADGYQSEEAVFGE